VPPGWGRATLEVEFMLAKGGYLFTELGEKLLVDSERDKGMRSPCIGERGNLSGLGRFSNVRTWPQNAQPPKWEVCKTRG